MSGGKVESHVEDLTPAALDGRDVVEVVDRHRAFVVETGVGPEEVVVGDKEDGECDGAIEVFEAGSGAGVELVSAIKAFDDLFELSVFGAFFILVFQADDGSSFQWGCGAL